MTIPPRPQEVPKALLTRNLQSFFPLQEERTQSAGSALQAAVELGLFFFATATTSVGDLLDQAVNSSRARFLSSLQ